MAEVERVVSERQAYWKSMVQEIAKNQMKANLELRKRQNAEDRRNNWVR